MVQPTSSFKIGFTAWLILCVSQSVLFSQDSDSTQAISKLVHRDYRYNSIIITMLDGSKKSGLIADISKDSLIILSQGTREGIAVSDARKVSFYGPVNRSGSVWAGFFTGMYLGNVLFYQQDEGHYSYSGAKDEPFALATRDYPEDIGAIGVNAFFGFVGMSIAYLASGGERQISFSFGEEPQDRKNEWTNFYNYLMGEAGGQNNSVHLTINMGSLSHRVLDSYTAAGTEFLYVYRYTSYLNFVRKIQISVEIYKRMRIGFLISFQGEPSVTGSVRNQDNSHSDISFRYDARGYYGTISYPVISRNVTTRFELNVGVGIGQVNPSLDIGYNIYSHFTDQERRFQYTESQLSAILLAELHYYITDHYSLLLAVDYCNSKEITITGNDEFQLPERKISFGNSSFGIGIGFHF